MVLNIIMDKSLLNKDGRIFFSHKNDLSGNKNLKFMVVKLIDIMDV